MTQANRIGLLLVLAVALAAVPLVACSLHVTSESEGDSQSRPDTISFPESEMRDEAVGTAEEYLTRTLPAQEKEERYWIEGGIPHYRLTDDGELEKDAALLYPVFSDKSLELIICVSDHKVLEDGVYLPYVWVYETDPRGDCASIAASHLPCVFVSLASSQRFNLDSATWILTSDGTGCELDASPENETTDRSETSLREIWDVVKGRVHFSNPETVTPLNLKGIQEGEPQ